MAAILPAAAASLGSGQAPAAVPAASLVALRGHVPGLAQPRFDIGEAPDSLQMGRLELVLAKTAAQQRALGQLLAAQQDPKSPQYHHWLTPAEYGRRFGASEATLAALSQWLQENGLQVDEPPASRGRVPFHGTRAQIEAAFHTEIHLFRVGGMQHYANVSDPLVPGALAPLIAAVRGLDDFRPQSTLKSRPQVTYDGGQNNYIGPGDFAVIYNLLPLYQAGFNGSGVTIAIAGQSDIVPAQASAYWTGFGLTPPSFSSSTVPGGTDPGLTNDGNETEAYADVELSGSLAPGASILLVRDTNALNAATYVIDQNLAAILNISFSACESIIPSAQNVALSALFQQAAAEGITVTVSSGDGGVAECATSFTQGTLASSGYAVNGLASTPYALAVGGTDFDPTRAGDWATGNAPGTLANAQAHIPEMVWNDTCANPLGAQVEGFASTTVFCNTTTLSGQPNPFLEVAGSGGGVSSCTSLVNNTCEGGYTVPSWQSGVAGTAGLSGRGIPDVSLIATRWVICSYDDSPCAPATGGSDIDLVRGTSLAAPAAAAIMALLDETAGRQGLVNTQLYALAAAEYGTPQAPSAAAATCTASLGATIGAGCVFYNVTAGSNATPCTVAGYSAAGSSPVSSCVTTTGDTNGIMETAGAPQYTAASGFNLATGLGSINAANLVLAIYLPAPSGLSAQSNGQSVNLSWSAEPHASSFNLYQGTQTGQEGSAPVKTGLSGTSTTVSGLQYGQSYFFELAAASAIGGSGKSKEAQATIVPAAPTGVTAAAGNATVTLTWSASSGATGYSIYQGTASGGEGAAPVQTAVSGTTSTISGLSNGTTYYFEVGAVDAGGTSALSSETHATPVAPPSGGGGGGLGALELALLAVLLALRSVRSRNVCWQERSGLGTAAVDNSSKDNLSNSFCQGCSQVRPLSPSHRLGSEP
jgi:subtilase family serine protease